MLHPNHFNSPVIRPSAVWVGWDERGVLNTVQTWSLFRDVTYYETYRMRHSVIITSHSRLVTETQQSANYELHHHHHHLLWRFRSYVTSGLIYSFSAALSHTIFSIIDKSGDGQVSTDELKPALRQLGRHVTDKKIDDIMRQIDADRSGTINLKEFLDGVTRHIIWSL